MGGRLEVDTQRLRALAPELETIAEDARLALTELRTALELRGACWGEDSPGKAFAETYLPGADKGLSAFEGLVENLRHMSSGIVGATHGFESADLEFGRHIRGSWPMTSDSGQSVGDRSAPRSFTGNGIPAERGAPAGDGVPPLGDVGASGHTPTFGTVGALATPTAESGTAGGRPSGGSDGPLGLSEGLSGWSAPPDTRPTVSLAGTAPLPAEREPPIAQASEPLPGAFPATGAAPRRTISSMTPVRPDTGSATGGGPSRTPWSTAPQPRPDTPTPWSRPSTSPPNRAPMPPPNRVSAPAFSPPPAHRPPAARGTRRTAGKGTDPVRRRPQPVRGPTAGSPATDPVAARIMSAMAERYGLTVVGFDTVGLDSETARQIADAITTTLDRHPFLGPTGLAVADLPGRALSRVVSDRHVPYRRDDRRALPDLSVGDHPSPASESSVPPRAWIELSRSALSDPTRFAEAWRTEAGTGIWADEAERRPVYAVLVRDLGAIAAIAVGPRMRRRVERSLIEEYLRISGARDRRDGPARVVAGYRSWRAQLPKQALTPAGLDPDAALVAAFTQVELGGEPAAGPARVLHRLLIDTARDRIGGRA